MRSKNKVALAVELSICRDRYAPSVFQKQLCPCISLSSDSAMGRQKLDPLKILVSDLIFILAGNKKKNIVSNEFEIWPDCGVSCP